MYGNSHPEGTCVLLEVPSVNSLVQYIQSLYQISDIFEVKGIKIAKVYINIAENNSFCPCKQCCALALYSLCYSVIKPCSYWDSNTLAAIVNNGTKFYHDLGINRHLTINDLPKYVTICGVKVQVNLHAKSTGVMICDSVHSLNTLIANHPGHTGFLMWFSSYSISCIFRETGKSYSLFAYDKSHIPPIQFVKGIHSLNSLLESICIIQKKVQCNHYEIQFVSCLCEIDNNERKRVMEKHRRKHKYDTMEPAEKKK